LLPNEIACNLQLFIGTFHSTCSFCNFVNKGLTFRAASSPPCMPCCCISSWRSCSPSWPAPSPSCKRTRRRGTSRCTLGQAAPHCHYLHRCCIVHTTSGSREQTRRSTCRRCKHVCTYPDSTHSHSCLHKCWILDLEITFKSLYISFHLVKYRCFSRDP